VTLGVLAVPFWMNPSDFLAFVGPAVSSIAHLRIIRFAGSNTSILLQIHDILFAHVGISHRIDPSCWSDWPTQLMPQTLSKHMMVNRSTQWRCASWLYSYRLNEDLKSIIQPEICHVVHVLSVQVEPDDALSQAISRMNSTYGPAQELPTCPVCLERMDSAVTGLITVPCSHTFHCMCLSKWGDSR